jgi:hypothetical protein
VVRLEGGKVELTNRGIVGCWMTDDG